MNKRADWLMQITKIPPLINLKICPHFYQLANINQSMFSHKKYPHRKEDTACSEVH